MNGGRKRTCRKGRSGRKTRRGGRKGLHVF